jgi:RNA polymerase sigma-70 factor, ECF subfamily
MADVLSKPGCSEWAGTRRMNSEEPSPPSVAAKTDHSLLRRFRGGEQEAATALYLRYADRLEALAKANTGAALAVRIDPEDVVQSVFRTFFRRASEGQYDVPEGEELWQLFLVISLNKIRSLASYHRAAKRDVGTTVALDPSDLPFSSQQRSQQKAMQVLELIVEESLGKLPQIQQTMIRLRIEGYEVAEIAEATERSKRSVERVLQQFRSRLGRLVLEEPLSDDAGR